MPVYTNLQGTRHHAQSFSDDWDDGKSDDIVPQVAAEIMMVMRAVQAD